MDDAQTKAPYPEPVARLLTLGVPTPFFTVWGDCLAMGFRAAHIPDLIRMATDEALLWADSKSLDVWAPVHAWRALAQLRAEAAIDPIIRMFRYGDERHDDVMTEDFPKVLAFIGPAAIPPLEAYLNDTGNGDWSRALATRGLAEMGQRYPDTRERCVAAMTSPLERFAQNSPNVNGVLIGSLLDLRAVESAPVMEKAFAADAVDVMVAGDWEDIQIDLGLLDERITPKRTMLQTIMERAKTEEAECTPYSGPVAQLLTLGGCSFDSPWADYLGMGLREEHIPELVRMATDEELLASQNEGLMDAPLHAWRALGQLRAEAAVAPLTGIFGLVDETGDDAVGEELPRAIGMIGPAAIPVLAAYLADTSHGTWARAAAKESIYRISLAHPESRDVCVAALTSQLERFTDNDADLNGTLVASLVDLAAVEAAPVMERAFAADAVDPFFVMGDWEDVQIALGLLDKRITPKFTKPIHALPPGMRPPPPSGKSREKAKKKQKDQKKSRKKNRRK